MSNTTIRYYADELERFISGDVWVDETFDKKLAGLDESSVFIRPLPNVHSIAEVISHLLEWRISILSNLRGGRRTLTEGDPHNWRTNEELSALGWQSLLAAHKKSQQEVIDLLRTREDSFLEQIALGETHSMRYYVDGLLQHDMYHLGQLGLIIKMVRAI